MRTVTRKRRLTTAEFHTTNPEGLDNEITAARWELVQAIRRKVPAFFERLRAVAYPKYARLANGSVDHGEIGYQVLSHANGPLTPILKKWAREFNLLLTLKRPTAAHLPVVQWHGEVWILEGALRTLLLWHRYDALKNDLDVKGFRQSVCVPGVITGRDHQFVFKDGGWDPTLRSWEGWRLHVQQRFEEALEDYQKKMGALVVKRGGRKSVTPFSTEHFDWLALYHFGNLSLDQIRAGAGNVDKTTISKGMHHAADLVGFTIRKKKLKSR